jgi:hypothetical protein
MLLISTHPFKKELCIHVIQMLTLRISIHLSNASDDTTNITSNAWIFDIAYVHHIICNYELFYNYNQFPVPIAVCRIELG